MNSHNDPSRNDINFKFQEINMRLYQNENNCSSGINETALSFQFNVGWVFQPQYILGGTKNK